MLGRAPFERKDHCFRSWPLVSNPTFSGARVRVLGNLRASAAQLLEAFGSLLDQVGAHRSILMRLALQGGQARIPRPMPRKDFRRRWRTTRTCVCGAGKALRWATSKPCPESDVCSPRVMSVLHGTSA